VALTLNFVLIISKKLWPKASFACSEFFFHWINEKKSLSTIQMRHYITHKFSDLYLNSDEKCFENGIFAFNSLGLFELRAQVLHKSKTLKNLWWFLLFAVALQCSRKLSHYLPDFFTAFCHLFNHFHLIIL
jgi:hypothetical protein